MAEIAWDVIRRSSSFRAKRNHANFSRERGNLTATHSYKMSAVQSTVGIVQEFVAGREVQGKKVQAICQTRHSSKPKKAFQATNLTHGLKRGSNAVNKIAWKNAGRPDLRNAALARLSKYSKSLKVAHKAPKAGRTSRKA